MHSFQMQKISQKAHLQRFALSTSRKGSNHKSRFASISHLPPTALMLFSVNTYLILVSPQTFDQVYCAGEEATDNYPAGSIQSVNICSPDLGGVWYGLLPAGLHTSSSSERGIDLFLHTPPEPSASLLCTTFFKAHSEVYSLWFPGWSISGREQSGRWRKIPAVSRIQEGQRR